MIFDKYGFSYLYYLDLYYVYDLWTVITLYCLYMEGYSK